MLRTSGPRLSAFAVAIALVPAFAAGQGPGPVPCTSGRISSIQIRNGSIFDASTTESSVLRLAYEFGNRAHMRTREEFIRSELLVAEGDCFDPALVLDSRIILERHPFLRQVSVRDEDDGGGGKRIIVETWDEWSLRVDLGMNYDEGVNVERARVAERNFFGRGILADVSYVRDRERKDWTVRFSTPRLFGRAAGSIAAGRSRRGSVLDQSVQYPFVGETGRVSARQAYYRNVRDFVYSSDGAELFSHVLVPVEREALEFGGARRIGEPDRSLILGVTFALELVSFPEGVAIVTDGDFDDPSEVPGVAPTIGGQLRPRGSARVALHVGRRAYRFREYVGLDAIRDVQTVGLGSFAGITLGQGIRALAPGGAPADGDPFVRLHASFGAPLGASLVAGGTTIESRAADGWRDVLAGADLAFFGRAPWLPNQTIFARVSVAGGWNVEVPFQMSLGGRDGVRALLEYEKPGGRQVIVTVEDRVALPWPRWEGADFGFTLFADAGRVWAGDVPYGVDSGWQGGVGVGLRLGAPSGTRNAYRPDVVFPIGKGARGPIFRLTIELNKLRNGFATSEVTRSRQITRGPEHF